MPLNSLYAWVSEFYKSLRYLWDCTLTRGLLVAIINNLVVIVTEIKPELCIMHERQNRLKRLCSKDYSPL